MGMPAVVKQTGTGAAVWFPDWMQTPFEVSLAAVVSGATGTFTVDVTWDVVNPQDTNYVAAPTWWSIVALGSANASANYTTPVQAMRVNMQTCVATSVVTVTFIQANFGR